MYDSNWSVILLVEASRRSTRRRTSAATVLGLFCPWSQGTWTRLQGIHICISIKYVFLFIFAFVPNMHQCLNAPFWSVVRFWKYKPFGSKNSFYFLQSIFLGSTEQPLEKEEFLLFAKYLSLVAQSKPFGKEEFPFFAKYFILVAQRCNFFL